MEVVEHLHEERQAMSRNAGNDGLPITGTFSVGGTMSAKRELPEGATVEVTIRDADGGLVASGTGYIYAVSFRHHRPRYGRWTERNHRVRVEG